MSVAAPIPYTPTARVSGLRRLATVRRLAATPDDDVVAVYFAEGDGDLLCLEFAQRLFKRGPLKGRKALSLVGATVSERGGQ